MERRALGHTGLDVSLLGLGTVKLGRDTAVKYPRAFRIPDDDAARRLLDAASELGINLLDTAPAYGSSEARLGKLLRGRRERWVLCTKVGEEFEGGRSRFDFSAAHTRTSVLRSLERLGTETLDVVLIHSDGEDLARLDGPAFETLQALKREGRVRAVGISHKTVAGASHALTMGCDVIMATLNPEHTEELTVIAEAGRRGCGVLIKKALASGHAGPEGLAFAARQPGVSSIVVGTVDPAHLRANAAAVVAP